MLATVRCLAVLVGVACQVALVASSADAHAFLLRSDPSNGATLSESPPTAELWFSEEVSAPLSWIRLLDEDGNDVRGAQVNRRPLDPHLLLVTMPRLTGGGYGLAWRVTAADDGHTTSGVIAFGVAASAAAAAPVSVGGGGEARAFDVARRWLGLLLLAGAVGGFAVAALVVPPPRGASDGRDPLAKATRVGRRRILRLVAVCSVLAALVGLVDAIVQLDGLGGASARPTAAARAASLLRDTRWGHLWLVREAALLALGCLAVALASRGMNSAGSGNRKPRLLGLSGGLAVVVLAWTEALGSHAASVQGERQRAVLADAAHVLAASVWIGALAALVVLLWRPAPGEAGGLRVVRACRGRFSRLVASSVALLILTGLYSAGREVGAVDDLWTTAYGRALLVKVFLLTVMGALGLTNSARLHDALGKMKPLTRRLVLGEAAVGVAVLLAVAVLVSSPPPREQALVASPQIGRTGVAGDLVVTVTATPNRPGPNWFTVVAASSRRPPPAPIDGVDLELTSADGASSSVPLRLIAPDTYVGVGTVERSGLDRVTMRIQRPRQPEALGWGWPHVAAAGSETGGDRLAPYANGLAWALVIALVTAAGLFHMLRFALARMRRRAAWHT